MIGIPIILVDVVQFVNTLARQNKKTFCSLPNRKLKKIPASFFNVQAFLNDYFSEIAVTGQTPTQVKQEMQTSSLHPDFPFSSNESALTGQAPTQAPQPMHASLSTVTGIFASLCIHYRTISVPWLNDVLLEQLILNITRNRTNILFPMIELSEDHFLF